MKKYLAIILVTVLLGTFMACRENEPGEFITVLTGPTSGIFFPIGGGFSSHLRESGFRTSVTATGATLENIRLIQGGQGELAIAMSDAVTQAIGGFGAFEGEPPAENLRALMGLWPNYTQIVTTADSGIRSFEDLRGRRVGVGAPGSGVELNARMIYWAHGMTYDDSSVDFLSYGTAIDQIRNGLLDAAFVTSGLGNATIMELGFTRDIFFIPVEGDARQRLMDRYPFFGNSVIAREVYGTDEETETVFVMNVMLVDVNLPNDVVYNILENVFSPEGLRTIHATHSTAAAHIRLETALRGITGTPIPLHDGAIEFYRARGMLP